jgi:hypothetical protein
MGQPIVPISTFYHAQKTWQLPLIHFVPKVPAENYSISMVSVKNTLTDRRQERGGTAKCILT